MDASPEARLRELGIELPEPAPGNYRATVGTIVSEPVSLTLTPTLTASLRGQRVIGATPDRDGEGGRGRCRAAFERAPSRRAFVDLGSAARRERCSDSSRA